MPDMLRDALAFLTEQLATHAARTVTYEQDGEAVEVRATFGRKLLRLADEFGSTRIEWTDMDFLIPATDLAIADVPITPRRGDRVRVSEEDEVQTFEVLPFGNEPPWRWSDPHQSMYRIHTKHIGTEVYG